ncbi:DUF397 domain-containing protein [Streptomyces sp. NBC_00885]|uniref:DUF397 domain-containing protein n=1 Tax=Streptomyces sp. NBC_00885 TaxID=2975857 RepID=UPI0038661DAF|nr:DUF397 domain-containing protein [Streptomyces sp. NBC_00885]
MEATAPRPESVHVRDSNNVTGPTLALEAQAWAAFLGFPAARTQPERVLPVQRPRRDPRRFLRWEM